MLTVLRIKLYILLAFTINLYMSLEYNNLYVSVLFSLKLVVIANV